MSKRDNKRFKDTERKSAPKRGGKNRRDYGESYEPKRKASGRPHGDSRRQALTGMSGSKTVRRR